MEIGHCPASEKINLVAAMTQKRSKVAPLQIYPYNMHLASQLAKTQNTQRVDLLDTCITSIRTPQTEIYTMHNEIYTTSVQS